MHGLSLLRGFLADRRGNIAILFGLCLVPLSGAIAVAVDYSFANQARSRMQAALDMTGLALSKMMPLTQAELDSKGRTIFLANLGKTPLTLDESNVADQLTITPVSTGTLSLEVHSEYPIKMAGVLSPFMPPTIAVSSRNEVKWGNTRLRVALVLDNSISMNQSGKIDALKTATSNLLQKLKDAATDPEDVYVAIIPFSTDVKLDPTTFYSHTEWIDFTAWDASHSSCSISGKTTQSSCESAHACSKNPSSNTTQSKCTNAGGTWAAGVWTTADRSTWNGCIMDRGLSNSAPDTPQGLDQNIDGLTSSNNTKWPADPADGNTCTNSMVALTNTWADLDTAMSKFAVGYSTNQPIGLVWGWQALQGTQGPLPVPAKDPAYAYSDTIILMSDGLNTQDRWYDLKTPNNPNVDKRMYNTSGSTISGTCKYIKDLKDHPVQIFTVQVNTDNEAQSQLLKNCATNTSMFWELKNANDLIATFETIGSALANIHLAM